MSMQPQAMPPFHQQQHSFRRPRDNGQQRLYSGGDHQYTANQSDVVRMLRDDWMKTERELLDYKRNGGNKVVEEHMCKDVNLPHFKPVDLSQVALSQYRPDNSSS